MSDPNLIKFPIWKQAVEELLESDLTYGSTITHDWLHEHFRMATPITATDQKKYQLEMAQKFNKFKAALLHDHLMDLKNIPRVGYMIIAPENQTSISLADFRETARKKAKECLARIINIRQEMLNEQARQENIEALGMISSLKAQTAKKDWMRSSLITRQKSVVG